MSLAMRLLIGVVVWVAVVIGAIQLSSVVADSVHSSAVTSAGVSGSGSGTSGSESGGASGSFDASSVKATDPVSLFRSANFARALTLARRELGAHGQLTDA